jgi:dTDP-4-amino-4,6-dideoxygalactose transaminase
MSKNFQKDKAARRDTLGSDRAMHDRKKAPRTTSPARSAPRPFDEPIYVTRPILPPLETYVEHLRAIWTSRQLTNAGPLTRALERHLNAYLQTPHISLFNNGTTALMTACRALDLSGEVITTPFTFPATLHALSWNGITPVFADIDPVTMTIDPVAIESLVTDHTTGILGVHIYGLPCAVGMLQALAAKLALHVVYDAAHALTTRINNQPITSFGDISALSFHATKLFHTAEGGALVARDPQLRKKIGLLRNFGIEAEATVLECGINGKMNELQAALGLCLLSLIENERTARRKLAGVYRDRLSGLPGVTSMPRPPKVILSEQYFVIRITEIHAGVSRDVLWQTLKRFKVFTRRYFSPLCSDYPHYKSLPSADPARLPVAHTIVREVLCLPFYSALGIEGVHRICDIIEHILHNPPMERRLDP